MYSIKEKIKKIKLTPRFLQGWIFFLGSYLITSFLPVETIVTEEVIPEFYPVYLLLGLVALIGIMLVGKGIVLEE